MAYACNISWKTIPLSCIFCKLMPVSLAAIGQINTFLKNTSYRELRAEKRICSDDVKTGRACWAYNVLNGIDRGRDQVVEGLASSFKIMIKKPTFEKDTTVNLKVSKRWIWENKKKSTNHHTKLPSFYTLIICLFCIIITLDLQVITYSLF